jgi:hypothetical protein
MKTKDVKIIKMPTIAKKETKNTTANKNKPNAKSNLVVLHRKNRIDPPFLTKAKQLAAKPNFIDLINAAIKSPYR